MNDTKTNGIYIEIAEGVSVWRNPEHLTLTREEMIEKIINSLSGMDGLIKVLIKNCNNLYPK